MSIMEQRNQTRMAISVREGIEHVLNAFAAGHPGELKLALEALKDADVYAHTANEKVFVRKLTSVVSSTVVT